MGRSRHLLEEWLSSTNPAANTVHPSRVSALRANARRDDDSIEYSTSPRRESYSTDFVFDLPADVHQPRLLVGDADPVSTLIIGHEDSPLHKKIYFAISPASSINNAKSQR